MVHTPTPLRIGFIGWGAINRRVADLLEERQGDKIEIAAVCLREGARADNLPRHVNTIARPADLAQLELDVVVEAAGRDSVSQWGEAALACSRALAVASASAFCDALLLERLLKTAERHGSQLMIPSGALAGIDAIAAAGALALEEVTHRIVKPPQAWMGTPAERLSNLDSLTKAHTFFRGSARQAATDFPQNANAAIIAALSGTGLDKTRVELVADPFATRNRHELAARGDFGKLEISIENRPLAANPKSSEMAALSLVRLVENRFKSFVI